MCWRLRPLAVLCCAAASPTLSSSRDQTPAEPFQVATDAAIHTVLNHFVSFTHDSYFLVADLGIQPVWTTPNLVNMVAALSPSIFRVGGGDMDYTDMNFPSVGGASSATDRQQLPVDPAPALPGGVCPPSPSGYVQPCGEQCKGTCVMNTTTWNPFLAFTSATGVKVVAGLNALQGRQGNATIPSKGPLESDRLHPLGQRALSRHRHRV